MCKDTVLEDLCSEIKNVPNVDKENYREHRELLIGIIRKHLHNECDNQIFNNKTKEIFQNIHVKL